MKISILSDRNSYIEDLQTEREQWISHVLSKNGYSISKDTLLDKAELLKYFIKNKISIIHNAQIDEYKVFINDEHIATWGRPSFCIKRDVETKELYYLIEIQCWESLKNDNLKSEDQK